MILKQVFKKLVGVAAAGMRSISREESAAAGGASIREQDVDENPQEEEQPLP